MMNKSFPDVNYQMDEFKNNPRNAQGESSSNHHVNNSFDQCIDIK